MSRRGVAETLIMEVSGHKTDSVFRRYHIFNESDLHKAVDGVSKEEQERMKGKVLKTGTLDEFLEGGAEGS